MCYIQISGVIRIRKRYGKLVLGNLPCPWGSHVLGGVPENTLKIKSNLGPRGPRGL